MVERQVFVTWYTPEEKLPEENTTVLVTVSGFGNNVEYDHAFMLADWCGSIGWDVDLEIFTVHAWCDIEPYKG